MNNTILILAAHPDDEILGCGGVIQKHVKAGDSVIVIIVTDGSSSQYPHDKVKADERIQACKDANLFLGVSRVLFLNFPDMKLDSVSQIDINNKIAEVVNEVKPNVIYTHSKTDLNNDHRIVAQSSEIICRPGSSSIRKMYSYEVLSSTEWSFNHVFQPNVFIDIESFIENKIEAFRFYKTEHRPYPHSRSFEGIQILAQYRGLQSGVKAAEAFKLIASYGD